MGDRADNGDVERVTESGGEPETKATRDNRSDARPHEFELARALRLALEGVMDGSVATALSSLGRRLLESLGDESLLCMRRGSRELEPMVLKLSVGRGSWMVGNW